MINALTIDVEDYFQVHAFSDSIRPEDWDSFESRVEKNTYHILDLIDSVESPTRTQVSKTRNLKLFYCLTKALLVLYLFPKEIKAKF